MKSKGDQGDDGADRFIVFAAYGEVMLAFQLLELTLWMFLAQRIKPGTSLDQAVLRVEGWDSTTLGRLYGGVRNQLEFPLGLDEELSGAVNTRNYLAHHFLREFAVVTPTIEARDAALDKMADIANRLERLEDRLSDFLREQGFDSTADPPSDLEDLRPSVW